MARTYQLGDFDFDFTIKNLNKNNLNTFINIIVDVFTVLDCSENDDKVGSYVCSANAEFISNDIKKQFEQIKNNDEQKLKFEIFEYEFIPDFDDGFLIMDEDVFLEDIKTRINALISRLKDTDIIYISHEILNIHLDDYDTVQERAW